MSSQMKLFGISIIIALNLSHVNAQLFQTIEVNTNVNPNTLHVQSYVFNLLWHDIIQTFDESSTTQTVDFQFVGDGNSNAMSYFDTTIVLTNLTTVYDLCLNIHWLQGDSNLPPFDTVLLDSECLSSSEILNIEEEINYIVIPAIFPNPAEDYFFVVRNETGQIDASRKVNIYNLSGILVQSIDFAPNNLSLEISTKTWDHGFYLVEVIENGVSISTKRVLVR